LLRRDALPVWSVHRFRYTIRYASTSGAAFVLALRVSRNSSTEINRSFRRDDR